MPLFNLTHWVTIQAEVAMMHDARGVQTREIHPSVYAQLKIEAEAREKKNQSQMPEIIDGFEDVEEDSKSQDSEKA